MEPAPEYTTADQEEPHVEIDSEIERLSILIVKLRDLRDRIKGIDREATLSDVKDPPRPIPSLYELLADGPKRIVAYRHDAATLIDEIHSALFSR